MSKFSKNLVFDDLINERSMRSMRSLEYQCPLVGAEADENMYKLKDSTIEDILYGPVKGDWKHIDNSTSALYPDFNHRRLNISKKIFQNYEKFLHMIENITDTYTLESMWGQAIMAPDNINEDAAHIGILHPDTFSFNAWFRENMRRELMLSYDIKFTDPTSRSKGIKLSPDQNIKGAAKAAANILHERHFHPYFVDGYVQKTSKMGRKIGCLIPESLNDLITTIEMAITGEDLESEKASYINEIESDFFSRVSGLEDHSTYDEYN